MSEQCTVNEFVAITKEHIEQLKACVTKSFLTAEELTGLSNYIGALSNPIIDDIANRYGTSPPMHISMQANALQIGFKMIQIWAIEKAMELEK